MEDQPTKTSESFTGNTLELSRVFLFCGDTQLIRGGGVLCCAMFLHMRLTLWNEYELQL